MKEILVHKNSTSTTCGEFSQFLSSGRVTNGWMSTTLFSYMFFWRPKGKGGLLSLEIMAELQSFDSSTDLGAGGLVDYFLRGGGNSGSKHGMVWIMIGAHKGYTKDGFLKPQTQRLRWIELQP